MQTTGYGTQPDLLHENAQLIAIIERAMRDPAYLLQVQSGTLAELVSPEIQRVLAQLRTHLTSVTVPARVGQLRWWQ